MSKWPVFKIKQINQYKGNSVNPALSPNLFFELYSVPSFDNDFPEIVKGAQIGSTKQSVQKGDVLLCKINPRINRVWCVAQYTNNPLIASSEWIIIRNQNIHSKYLQWYLKSDNFRNLIMAHVTGIGGSLTRAQPKQVGEYPIPVPPFDLQKKIADVLDKAKSLIDLRKKQIEKMDLLIKSKFIEMFGDPVTNPKKWRVVTFAEVATIDTHMTTDWEKYNGLPHIGIENIEKDTGHITKLKLVRDSELISGKYIFDKRHIIYSKIRPNLNKVALPDFTGVCSADAYPILPKSNTTRYYLAFILRSQHFLDYILSHSDRTNIPKVNKKQLAGFELPLPPVEDQNSFTLFVDSVEEQKYMLQHGLHKMEINYKSLMQEYFG